MVLKGADLLKCQAEIISKSGTLKTRRPSRNVDHVYTRGLGTIKNIITRGALLSIQKNYPSLAARSSARRWV